MKFKIKEAALSRHIDAVSDYFLKPVVGPYEGGFEVHADIPSIEALEEFAGYMGNDLVINFDDMIITVYNDYLE